MEWETPKAIPSVSRVSRLEASNRPTDSIELTRKQIETELEVMKLRNEVERLGGLRHRRQSPDWSEMGTLEEENNELRKCLQDAEANVLELQKQQTSISLRSEKEALVLRAKLEGLKDMNELLKAEKKKMKSQYEKAAKTIHALKSYLKDVPSVDEFNDVKASLTTNEAQLRDLRLQIDTKNLTLEKVLAQLSESEKKAYEAHSAKEEASMRLKMAEDKLRYHSQRLENTRKTNPADTEVLLEENSNLKIENDELKKYVQYLKAKNKQESNKKDAQILEKEARIERLGEELQAVNEQSVKYRETLDLLRASVKELERKSNTESKRIKILEANLSCSENSSRRDQETDKLLQKLTQELALCLRDIDALSLLSRQLVSGEDPNLSQLLGFDRPLSPQPRALQKQDGPESEDRLHVLQGYLVDIKRIKKEISEMRRILADKYAETLGTNMTSCITQ